jgi:transposase
MGEKIPERKERFVKDNKDMSKKELAEHLGISTTTVARVRSKIKEDTSKNIVDDLKQDSYLQDIDKKEAKTELQILKKKY